jgi:hypothetical protein
LTRGAGRTDTYRALGFTFAVSCNRLDLDEFLRHALAAIATNTQPMCEFEVVVQRNFHGHIVLDGEPVTELLPPQQLVSYLLHHINLRAVPATPDLFCSFAAAAATGDRAVLLPAPGDSGKTTLVAGLVEAGFDYVTDETVAIDPASLMVHGYPKPLSIGRGSFEVLARLRPSLSPSLEPFFTMEWQVPASDVRADSLAGPCTPRWLICPSYQPDRATALEPMSRASAIELLGESSSNFAARGREWLPSLAEIARRCDGYTLSIGDLDSAVACVQELVA